MERGKRTKVEDGELHLPEPIIQHIQSFMSDEEAAQTSFLSKSWHSAWSTRPSLYFDEYEQPEGTLEKTMQRYEKMNLNIESFRLGMDCRCRKQISFACELIVKAMRMGAVAVDFKLKRQSDKFVLPQQVLGSETLIRLSVANCKINLGPELPKEHFKLKSLILRRVYTGGDIIWNIISNCPLIEHLELSECRCLYDSADIAGRRTRMLLLKSWRAFDSPINPGRFHNLKSLLLEKVVIHEWLNNGCFSSRFPCLKDLALHHCVGYREIRICSHSLESISLAQTITLRATLGVPNIRKFKFSGPCIPSLSLKTADSSQWESDISIVCKRIRHCLNSSWFSKLNEFLTVLSPSKISLSLTMKISSEKSSGNVWKGLSKPPAVEVLKLLVEAPSGVCSDLLDGLFSSCRPKLITLYSLPNYQPFVDWKANTEFVKILCKTLIKEVSEGCFVPNSNKCGPNDEVTLECTEGNHDEWRPLCWKTLLDASPGSGDVLKIRFHLRW